MSFAGKGKVILPGLCVTSSKNWVTGNRRDKDVQAGHLGGRRDNLRVCPMDERANVELAFQHRTLQRRMPQRRIATASACDWRILVDLLPRHATTLLG